MTATATNEPGAGLEVDPELKDAGASPGIISLRSAKNPRQDERVPAFRINGTTYSIATKPRTNQGLKYMNLSRTRGSAIAIDFMLETLLGTDGYQALMDFDDLTDDDLEAIIKAASRIMAGAIEGPKGKQPRGSKKSPG
jgi:hypothetical protein